MDLSSQILSDIIIYSKYAKYIPELQRRETWQEIVKRNSDMHVKRFPQHEEQILNAFRYVEDKKVLPSMRSMQFGGRPIELAPSRAYNCCFVAVDDWRVFSEVMFLLLGGSGVGYSVQFHHIAKLPSIKRPTKSKRYLIDDSIIGWANAIRILTKAFFLGTTLPDFDYNDIRPKGTPLKTAGGKAPGPDPLRRCLNSMRAIFERYDQEEQLRPIDAHDILCHIADAVLAGGIRRSAMISLFSLDDEDMLTAKTGEWYKENGQRSRANNSAVVLRHRVRKKDFKTLWDHIRHSGAGEPGVFMTHDSELGTNPCGEVSLRNAQMCNLTEINTSDSFDNLEFLTRAGVGAFLGTLQATLTNFHYLREIWKKTTEKEALLGVGMTGIASHDIRNLPLLNGAEMVLKTNETWAAELGINKAARTTLVKPSGTTSLVLGCSSGIHAWHSEFYIRRLRAHKTEALYTHLMRYHPELVRDDLRDPNGAVIEIPMRAPEGAVTRHRESAMDLLERVAAVYDRWVTSGHRSGHNTHNVSTTIYVKENEWDSVGEWAWEHRDSYNGLAFFPFDGGTYVQAPHEDISEIEYYSRLKKLHEIDLSSIREDKDNTEVAQELACAGGSCEIS